ncbi:MAG: sulfite exporter TauE/SafE family protein [Alphaproteobacteria bacterium]|nr:sulfite exporter TauE/SafE family protein [Alphaproteobacteria bacterium]
MPSTDVVVLILAGAMSAGFVSGLAGFAFAMVSLGFWAHVLAPTVAAPLIVACAAFAQIYSMRQLRRGIRFDLALPFILGGLIGIPLGAWLLVWIDRDTFRLSVGIFLIVYTAIMLALGVTPPQRWGGKIADAIIGWIGGVMGGIAGLTGAVPTIWCALRGWSRDDQRGAMQPFNFALQIAAVATYGFQGLLTQEVALLFALALPAMIVGVAAGVVLYRRVDDVWFRRIVLWLLLVSGITLVI